MMTSTRAKRCALLALVLTAAACSSGSKQTAPGTTGPTGSGGTGTTGAGGSGSGAADAGTTDTGPADSGLPDVHVPPPPPVAYLTTDDLSQALSSITPIAGAGNADAVVTLDTTTKYQTIVGFGASITDSSSYVMKTYLSPAALDQTITALFDPAEGVGLSMVRQPLGASDFSSVGNFSYDDTDQDTSLGSFNINQDLKATIPILKQALARNPKLFVLGTPWSAPGWMKLNGSMNGSGGATGNPGLVGNDYGPFGQYFVKFVQAYAAQGIPVGAVTPQNEPLNGSASYPGMSLTAPYELQLIAENLGPAFKTAGLSTFVWAYDHNWDVESYPEQVMADPTAAGFTEGAAFHCYGGDASAMSTFHERFPEKSVYMTECSGGDWQGDPFANTIDLLIDSTSNWARAVTLWNMALDENKGPTNNGCQTCRGVVTVNSQSGDVTYNADYYALGHFSKVVLPGAARVASTSSNVALHAVAFENEDHSLVVVAHNTGTGTMTVMVGSGPTSLSVSVPANAAVTFRWQP